MHKLALALGAGALAISLLLGASIAQAADVILDSSNNVIRIENLEVFDDQGGPELYDVEFVFDTGSNLYGSNLLDFDFEDEEDAFLALQQVNEELNLNSPTPVGAGPNGTDQFFIGVDIEDEGFVAAIGGENFQGIWDGCDTGCIGGAAVLASTERATYAKFTPADGGPPPSNKVNLSGTVENPEGTGLCAMVLASGQYEFSCNPNGPFSLTDLPRENDGSVKRQVYVDGFFPNVQVLQGSVDETVVMSRAGSCPNYNAPYSPGVFPGDAGKRINISGMVLLQNSGTPVCAMVLANGQYQFSCDGSGSYALNIPLDDNGQFKLQVYADGFAPITQRFDESSVMNDVRMARAAECSLSGGGGPPPAAGSWQLTSTALSSEGITDFLITFDDNLRVTKLSYRLDGSPREFTGAEIDRDETDVNGNNLEIEIEWDNDDSNLVFDGALNNSRDAATGVIAFAIREGFDIRIEVGDSGTLTLQ
jgi:hypothetical protein